MGKKSDFNLTQIISGRSAHKEKGQIDGQVTLQDWMEWKEDIRNRIHEIQEDFIVIGYRLKQIRDSRAYERDGYRNLHEFAEAEYGLKRATVYRLCQINDAFSVGGNSMEIREEYRGYDKCQLQEMLTMTEEERACITPETTVREIREAKQDRDGDGKQEAAPEDETGENGRKAEESREPAEEEDPEDRKEAAGEEADWMNPPEAAGGADDNVATSRLKEEWKEPETEPKPHELPPKDAVYWIPVGKSLINEIENEERSYLILKAEHRYRAGNKIILREHDGGKATGKILEIPLTHVTMESGGLMPGYCILGFLDWSEECMEVDEDA